MYPSFRFKLEARRPIEGYPDVLEHIGDHVLKRRLDLGMNRKTTAKRLGTNAWSLRHWETNRREVEIRRERLLVQRILASNRRKNE